MKEITDRLFAMQDLKYKEFVAKLTPGIDPDTIIGVRIPELRAYAAELSTQLIRVDFMNELPHKYYEENNLHAFLIERIRDFKGAVYALDEFLPYVDNWSTCDSMKPVALKRNLPLLYEVIKEWIGSSHPFTVRYAIELLMSLYLDEAYDEKYPKLVSQVQSDNYYVKMMIAWYFATALAKQYESIVPYIENKVLEDWIHNKTIQKATESKRITPEQKDYLRGFTLNIQE